MFCDICNRGFYHLDTLRDHVANLFGLIKRYQCDICQKLFKSKPSLRIHRRIHSGEKPFQCETCMRSFSVKSTLTKHIRLHTGELPYTCRYCPRKFRKSGTLRKHIQVHSTRPHGCEICLKRFVELPHHKNHMRKVHNMDIGKE